MTLAGVESIHLTQLRLARRLIHDTQITHTTVLAAVGQTVGRVLWASPRRDMLIVQASGPVTADRMDGVAAARCGPVRTRWDVGDRVRLSLIGNPARAGFDRGRRGIRRPLPIGECDAWLRRKLDGAVDLETIEVEELGGRHGRRGDGPGVTHRLVGFYAAGVVGDPGTLEHLIRSGVGPGKAYGAGLLLVGAA